MGNKVLQAIFDKMESIGWKLDDFKDIYNTHKNYLSDIVKKFENGEIEENELVWCAQFLSDFLDCLEGEDTTPQTLNIPPRFEMISNAPKYKVGDHVYILRRVNDSRVISSEKIRQVHAGKRAISYTLYGETIRRKQADIFKTREDAERELKGGTTL